MNYPNRPSNNLAIDPWYRRFWTLCLLNGIEEGGCSPIELRSFNILAYLANAVAQCYAVPSLDPTILKKREGPLYPLLIWDLDRLVGMRLVDVSNIVLEKGAKVRNASYAINQSGLDVLTKCRNLNDGLGRAHDALRSTALAYARNRQNLTVEGLIKLDGNYANTQVPEGAVVDFGDWDDVNASANSVEFILDHIDVVLRQNPSIGVNLYARYLSAYNQVGDEQ